MAPSVRPITANLPSTLAEWRAYCTWPTLAVWDPLRDWFSSQGLRIFQPTLRNTGNVKPPVNELRAYDGTYGTHYEPPRIQLTHYRAIHSIARTTDGRDVLIRLIAKGGKGLEELDVLQHVATGHQAFLGDNHCLPMLRTLVLEDMTFGVFPYMAAYFTHPWYYDVEEVFDAVLQLLQGFEFLHRNLVAHRDVGADNILINFAEGWLGPLVEPGERPNPFRGLFPARYYIIDFEFSIRFPEDSAPDQRVVTGLPILRNGFDHPDDYGREIAPEMLFDRPHCPFKSDIFQLGKLFYDYFHLLEPDYPELIRIFRSMIEPDSSCRPTAGEALKFVHEYHDGFTRAQLKGPVPEPDFHPMPLKEMWKRMDEANERQAAREKKRLEAELAKVSIASS